MRLLPPSRIVFGSIDISRPSHSANAALQTGFESPDGGAASSMTTSNRNVVNGGAIVSKAGFGTRSPLQDVQQTCTRSDQDDGDKLDRQGRGDLQGDQEAA